jgi:hypothetical protein
MSEPTEPKPVQTNNTGTITVPQARLQLPEVLALRGQRDMAHQALLQVDKERLTAREQELQRRMRELGLLLQSTYNIPDAAMPRLQVNFEEGFVIVPEYQVDAPVVPVEVPTTDVLVDQ